MTHGLPGRSDRRGFTLIELLIVVAIIGIARRVARTGLLRAKIPQRSVSHRVAPRPSIRRRRVLGSPLRGATRPTVGSGDAVPGGTWLHFARSGATRPEERLTVDSAPAPWSGHGTARTATAAVARDGYLPDSARDFRWHADWGLRNVAAGRALLQRQSRRRPPSRRWSGGGAMSSSEVAGKQK